MEKETEWERKQKEKERGKRREGNIVGKTIREKQNSRLIKRQIKEEPTAPRWECWSMI